MSDTLENDVLSGRPTQRGHAVGAENGQAVVATKVIAEFLRRFAAEDRTPKLLIDSHCRVLWASHRAEDLLQPPLPLWIEDGIIRAKAGSPWPAFVENLTELEDRLLLGGETPCSWVLVRGWAEWRNEQRLVFLRCTPSWPLRSVEESGMAADFGLTKAEAAVLDQFARLQKPHQIAEHLRISISTVRSHLKQIHVKLSVNSSVHLLRITRAYSDK